jgi:ParB-like chromosome segregation protein Spo0J
MRINGERKEYFLVPVTKMEHALIKDPDHFLFDHRVNNPVNENLVRSIMEFGIQRPIEVQKLNVVERGGDKFQVFGIVEGRQRVINGLEADKRLKETHGDDFELQISVIVVSGEDEAQSISRMATSFIRSPDEQLNEAMKMGKLYALTQSFDKVAAAFGCSALHVRRRLDLASLPNPIKQEIKKGTMGITEAVDKGLGKSSKEAKKIIKEEGISDRKTVGEKKNRRVRRTTKETHGGERKKAPNKEKFVKTLLDFGKEAYGLAWTPDSDDPKDYTLGDIIAAVKYAGGLKQNVDSVFMEDVLRS